MLFSFEACSTSFVFFCHQLDSAVNLWEITGAANILSNRTPVVIDAAFGSFRQLLCCFTDCTLQLRLACMNCFINTENNFVLFSHKIN